MLVSSIWPEFGFAFAGSIVSGGVGAWFRKVFSDDDGGPAIDADDDDDDGDADDAGDDEDDDG